MQGTNTGNDTRWAEGHIVIDPATGLPLVWSSIGGGAGGSLAAVANDAGHAPAYANGGAAGDLLEIERLLPRSWGARHEEMRQPTK